VKSISFDKVQVATNLYIESLKYDNTVVK